MKTGIVWFRNDLRIDDHEPLDTAARDCERLVCVYVLPEQFFENDSLGFPVVGAFRRRFLAESLSALNHALFERGQHLILFRENACNVFNELAKAHGQVKIYAYREPGTDENVIEQAVEKTHSVEWSWGKSLIHLDDLPFNLKDLPHIFTEFRKQVEKDLQVRPPVLTRSLPPSLLANYLVDVETLLEVPSFSCDERVILPFKGGFQAGLQRIQHYFWDSDAVAHYYDSRNELLGADNSAKFSPWLANGSLSPRQIYAELIRYEKERTKNKSTYWIFFELLWRDFFQYTLLKHGSALFGRSGLMKKQETWKQDQKQFQLWCQGKTGSPFVDANLRELSATGWMSNRGRQNVAAFLAKNLCIDWTWGARWFESQLIDYDVGSNWGNWSYISGVGNDPRPNRWFNVLSQAERYDPEGAYVRTWLPDLNDG
jgi:deoxyribodipyrimidine photo-lyase